MAPVRGHLRQRLEDKCPLVQARMGQDETAVLANYTIVIEKIEIERACLITLMADTAEGMLDGVQASQKIVRSKRRFDPHHGIHEPRLIGTRHRLALVKGRTCDNDNSVQSELR